MAVGSQERIEGKLAKQHLGEGARALYDLMSSTYYVRRCPLAARGDHRENKGRACITWGLLADAEGRPVAVETYAGKREDPATVEEQVDKLGKRFGLSRVVLVGDGGMLTQARIDALKKRPELGWISALPSQAIPGLAEEGALQLSLFDEQNLAEITSEAYPGERLIVCHNPVLAEDQARTREGVFEAAEKELETRLDGVYIVRTSEPAEDLSAEDAVRAYKSLEQVEQAFRCLKTLDLRVRPIHHRTETEPPMKAHVFLCMLAYYVEWHLRQALAPLLFQDEELLESRWTRGPVVSAETGPRAKQKKKTPYTPDGWPVHSLQTLLADLATCSKNTCRVDPGKGEAPVYFETITEPTPFQQHVFGLLGLTSVPDTPRSQNPSISLTP